MLAGSETWSGFKRKVVLVPGLQLKNFSKNVGQLSRILADCSKTSFQTLETSSLVDSGHISKA